MSFRLASLAALLSLSLFAPRASAFCRTTTCDPMTAKTPCPEVPGNPGCADGQPLNWPSPCVGVWLQKDASSQVSFSEFERVARAAFGSWNGVLCEAGAPSIHVDVVGTVTCNEQEFNDNKGNANVIMFRDSVWPYEGQSSVLALTTLTYGIETGTIYDADMEINAVKNRVTLSTGDDGVETDLESIMAHEAGHLLGLAHTTVNGSTMVAVYLPKTTQFRSLEADDKAGLCAAYPPDRKNLAACDVKGPTSRSLGFSDQCGGADVKAPEPPEQEESCACSAPGRGAGAGLGAALALAALATLGARRRR